MIKGLVINLAGADLEGGVQGVRPPPPTLKFEKCPFYLGFLQIYLVFFIMLWCPFYLDPPSSEKLDPPQLSGVKIQYQNTVE